MLHSKGLKMNYFEASSTTALDLYKSLITVGTLCRRPKMMQIV